MAEYIDRNAFLEHMKKTNRYFDVKHDIENFPATDVAPVVRCKDCEHFDRNVFDFKGFKICPASGMYITPEDYCSYAERKET